jgi:hypothetical protein
MGCPSKICDAKAEEYVTKTETGGDWQTKPEQEIQKALLTASRPWHHQDWNLESCQGLSNYQDLAFASEDDDMDVESGDFDEENLSDCVYSSPLVTAVDAESSSSTHLEANTQKIFIKTERCDDVSLTETSQRKTSESEVDDMDLSQDDTIVAHRSLSSISLSNSQSRDCALEIEQDLVMHNWKLLRSMCGVATGAPMPPPIPIGRAYACFQFQA